MKTNICLIGGLVASSVHGFTAPYRRDGKWTPRTRYLKTNLSPDPQGEAPLIAMDTMQSAKAVKEQDDRGQTSKVDAPTDLQKAKANLLATPIETETKQRAEDPATAAAEMTLVTEKVAQVQAAEFAIENVLEIKQEQVEAAAKSVAETASRAQKAEATRRALLATRFEMEAKVLAATPLESNAQEEAEPEVIEKEKEAATEALIEVEQEQVEAAARVVNKTVEATARALLAVRLDVEAKKRAAAAVACEQEKADEAEAAITEAVLEAIILKEQDDKEQSLNVVPPTSARKAEATAGMSNEQTSTVDIEKVAATARALLATLEARQRSKNQRALLATRLEMEAKQRAATAVALDQEKAFKAKAKAALEIEQEAAVKAEVEKARIRKAENYARELLASHLSMETKQRGIAAQPVTASLEQENDPPEVVAPTDFKKAEANARGVLAMRIEMEVKQRAKNQIAAVEEQRKEKKSPAPTDFKKAEAETPTLNEIFDGHNVQDAFEDTITSDGDHKAENTLVRGDVAIGRTSSNGSTAPSSSASSEEDAWMRERPRLGRGRGSNRRKTRRGLEMEVQKAKDTSTINDDDIKLRTMIQAETSVESADIGQEQPQKVIAAIDLKNTEAAGGTLLAARLELEADQRAKNQATPEKGEVKSEPAVNTHKGKVKWFNTKRGYGAIIPDDSDEAIFVHRTAIQYSGYRTLKALERVDFQIAVDEYGRKTAVHVTGPDGGPLLVELRKSKVQNDSGEITATAATVLVKEKAAEVAVAEAATENVLEIKQEQIEAVASAKNKKAESTARPFLAAHPKMEAKQRATNQATVVKSETEKARTQTAETNARGLLAARLEMEAKQRAAAVMALEHEKALEIEREAVVRAETEKARIQKAEANARGLLPTRLEMEAKQRAAAAMALKQEKALEIEREAAVKAETEKARTRKAEANARGLLATRLEMEAKQRAVAAAALQQEKALELEWEAAVKAETEQARTRKAEANARGLLATRLEMEIKQRAAALEQEKALEIEREAAVKAETEKARTRKAEANARELLATRLDMEAKERAVAAVAFAQEKALEIEREAAVKAESKKARNRKAEGNARGLLAARLEMEAKQRAAAVVALAQEKALAIEREAHVKAETEKARIRKVEADARGLLATRLDMEAKQRAAAAVALAQEKALEIVREASFKAEAEKARIRKVETNARGLLAKRLEIEAKQRAKIHDTAVEVQNDREEPPAETDFKKAEPDVKLRGKNQAATAVEFADTTLEQAEQPSKVVAPTDIKKAEDTARLLLATCLEVEAKERVKNQSTPTTATAEEAAQVAAAEAAIEAVLDIATEAVLEIEQEQLEAAANAGLVADLKEADLSSRVFLETRLEMAAKQRAKRAAKDTAVKKQEQPPAPTDVKKAEEASRALLATRLEMEARQRAWIALEGEKANEVEAAAKAVLEQEQLEAATKAEVRAKQAEATARALLATRLDTEAKVRAVEAEAHEEAEPVAEVSEHELEPEPVAKPEPEPFLSPLAVTEPETKLEEVKADVVFSPETAAEPEPARATRLFFAKTALQQAEQALKVGTLTDFNKMEATGRVLLATPSLFFADTTLEQEEQSPKVVTLSEFKKAEAKRLEMEAEQRAKNKAATATAAADIALAPFEAAFKVVLEIIQKPKKEATARALLAPRLGKAKVRTATPVVEVPPAKEEVKAAADVAEPEPEPVVKTKVFPPVAFGKPEPEPKQPEPEEQVKPRAGALVAVNQESIEFTSGLIGGAVGYAFDGAMLAAIVAATANYVSRKQDESDANLMQSLSKTTIEAYNTVARIEAKLQVLEKSGKALEVTLEKLDGAVDTEAMKQVEDTLAKVTTRVVELNEDYDLVGTGLIALKAIGDLTEKVFIAAEEVNKEYHLTDRAAASIKEAVDKTTSGLKWPND